MSNRQTARVCGVLLAMMWLAGVSTPMLAQSGTGTVAGRVVDAAGGEVLPGASVTIEGTVLRTAVDRTGSFRLAGVPAGAHTVVVSYLGHLEERASIVVTADTIVTLSVQLRDARVVSEEVTVRAESIQEGQARALNQQRTAPNIMNIVSSDQIGQFPDANAAEATQRIPGISIERDQGEGRYVLVRGTEARLNAMMIDGERIPSPEGEIRSVALDVIPTDLLQAIEVSKALTPDMDADAIGGAVNLITKQAPSTPRALFTAAGGFNSLMSDAAQSNVSGVVGRRFNGGRVGLILSGSASHVNRGSDNFEVEYDDGEIEELSVRDYTVNRQRYGLNGAVDFRPTPNSQYVARGIWNRFSDQEYRRANIYVVPDGEIDRELKDRLETQTITSVSFGGRQLTRRGWEVDFNVSTSYANEIEPDAFYTVVRQEDVTFNPNVSPSSIDPDNIQVNPLNEDFGAYELDGFSAETNRTTDRDVVGSLNLRVPLRTSPAFTGFVKVGGKVRAKTKMQDASTIEYETDDTVLFPALLEGGRQPRLFLGGRYQPGPHISPGLGRALRSRADIESEFDFETDAADYRATEQVMAGYVMAELYLGPRTLVLPGVRLEATRFDYTGYEVLFDDEGDYASTRTLTGRDSSAQVLPGVHLRHNLSDDANLRAALTRTLARPNYYDLVPYQLVLEEDEEVELGNPALRPTTSWNVDLLAERYLRSVGVISGGFFYKRLTDYIYPFTFSGLRNGDEYEFFQPQNGSRAWLRGIEFAYQSQLRALPAPWDGIGLYANYTFTDSEATFPDRDEVSALPGQSRHLGNVSIWFEKRGFAARVSMNFHGQYVAEVAESADEDQYYDNHKQVDLSVSQALNRRIRIFADVLNLTNSPLRYYQGVRTRPIQEEYYRWWANFGVRVGF